MAEASATAGGGFDGTETWQFIGVTAAVGAIILLAIFLSNLFTKEKSTEKRSTSEVVSKNGASSMKAKQVNKKQKNAVAVKKSTTFSHQWLACSLKSHSQKVLGIDFSINGKYLSSCSEDRTCLIWSTKEFNKKEHKCLRANVHLDHATQVKFSPDSKAFITSIASGNCIRVFKIGKKEDGSPGNITALDEDFPPKLGDTEILSIGISCTGTFIMTAHKASTIILIWNLKGEVLASLDTRQMHNNFACVSPCGRFVASAGFTPDVKVWEVCFSKSGDFKDVVRAFELKGHSAGIYSFSFNLDSTRMASVSKDGTWKLWDTDIEYKKKQDPYLLLTGKIDYSANFSLIALSPDALSVAIAHGTNISVYNVHSGTEVGKMEDVHTQNITCLAFSMNNKYLVSAGDKHIRVFHNVEGYRATAAELSEKVKHATSEPHRNRLQQQIGEAENALATILSGTP